MESPRECTRQYRYHCKPASTCVKGEYLLIQSTDRITDWRTFCLVRCGGRGNLAIPSSSLGNDSTRSKIVGSPSVAQSLRVSGPGPIQDMLDPDIPTMQHPWCIFRKFAHQTSHFYPCRGYPVSNVGIGDFQEMSSRGESRTKWILDRGRKRPPIKLQWLISNNLATCTSILG